MLNSDQHILSVVFDLDGTLYSSPELAEEIAAAADVAVASARGVSLDEGKKLIRTSRQRLTEINDEEPTLSLTCMELGLELPDLHRYFEIEVKPERYLLEDPVLKSLLDSLKPICDLYIYTNNNSALAERIMKLLGVGTQFRKIYSIEYCWLPKPDREAFQKVLEDIGGPPESFLFVGDRDQVDLQPAKELGIKTLLVRETADLLQVHKLLGVIP
ncbi:MAG: HAD family hydrolase [Desulfuromonas sp.]|nr:MAG: HAD family hydrolase [Desulfuromonas sp.]